MTPKAPTLPREEEYLTEDLINSIILIGSILLCGLIIGIALLTGR